MTYVGASTDDGGASLKLTHGKLLVIIGILEGSCRIRF